MFLTIEPFQPVRSRSVGRKSEDEELEVVPEGLEENNENNIFEITTKASANESPVGRHELDDTFEIRP